MARPATGQVVRPTPGQPCFALRFRAYGKREYLNLGRPEDGWTLAMAQRELAVVLRDVDLGTWRPPRPDPAPAKDVEPDLPRVRVRLVRDQAARDRAEHRQQLRERPHQPPAAVLQGPPPLRDHGGRGRPLPPEQGARSRRDHGRRRERDADDGLIRRSPRPELPPPRAPPVGALDQHAHRPAGADPRRRRRPRPHRRATRRSASAAA